jgi:PAS domain S-box-containing protein
MRDAGKPLGPIQLRRYVWTLAICWTIAIGATLSWRLVESRNQAIAVAREESLNEWEQAAVIQRILGYSGIWLFGLCGIALLSRQLGRQVDRRYQAEQELHKANELLEQRVAARTAELAEANRQLLAEVTERKQAERWLLESERRFRGYFEQGLLGMAILSPERELVEVNPRLCRLLHFTEDRLLGRRWSHLTVAEDRLAEESQFQRLLAGEIPGNSMETRFACGNGAILPARLSVQCLRKEDRSIDCILVSVQDTT